MELEYICKHKITCLQVVNTNIKHEKEILALKTEHKRELQAQQELYNNKVKSLLDRLEYNQATAPKVPSISKKKAPTNKKIATGTEQAENLMS